MTGWATYGQLRSLRGDEPGRIPLGKAGGLWRRPVSLPPRQSLLILGPTQSGKTTRLAAPILRSWVGPVLATSVKMDLVEMTNGHRPDPCWIFDPTSATTARWSPLDGCGSWGQAVKVAHWMTEAAMVDDHRIETVWFRWAERMLAVMIHAAARTDKTMVTVVRWVDTFGSSVTEVAKAVDPEGPAAQAWTAAINREPKQRSSILSAAELIVAGFADPTVSAATAASDFTVADLFEQSGTLYLVGPQHEQSRVRSVFAALTQSVLAYVHDHAPVDPPLLCVLDELANIAPIPDLDVLASTCAGEGAILVSVFQSLAQLETCYGAGKARTIIENHAALVALPSGMKDVDTLRRLSDMLGEHTVKSPTASDRFATRRQPLMAPELLPRMGRGHGLLFAGSCPPAQLYLTKGL